MSRDSCGKTAASSESGWTETIIGTGTPSMSRELEGNTPTVESITDLKKFVDRLKVRFVWQAVNFPRNLSIL
jgi:hypothetical protein